MEIDIWSYELLRIYKGSIGRRVNMEWEYIATDKKWTGAKIAEELRNLKTYFFGFDDKEYPVVKVKYTHVIPVAIDFRLRDINIQYGPELVLQGGIAYPLYTKVNVTLEVATDLGSPKGIATEAAATALAEEKMKVRPLKAPDVKWY